MAARKQAIPTPALVLLGNKTSAAVTQHYTIPALGAYGAVILSFLGGIRWGKLLNDKSRIKLWRPLTLSIVPSLVAWFALLLAPLWMLSELAVGFVLQYSLDIEAVKRGQLPTWFGRLRTILTTGAVLSLLTGLIAYSLS